MKLEYNLSMASELAFYYEETVKDFTRYRELIRSIFYELTDSGWSGDAVKSFLIRYEQWDMVAEILGQKLLETGQIIDIYNSDADVIRQNSENLSKFLD